MTLSSLTLLEQLRVDANLEREDLFAKSGVAVRTIRQLESGETPRPRLATLKPLADVLGCKPSELAADFRARSVVADTPLPGERAAA